MDVVENLLKDIQIPAFKRVSYSFDEDSVADPEIALAEALKRENTLNRIKSGDSVAITVGSRAIANIDVIIKTLIFLLRERHASPFIIPAMGSHGGASAQGQLKVLELQGISEARMGVEIKSSMETSIIGFTKGGMPVHVDRNALEFADHIIPVGRVKPHTDFRGSIESGILKMLAIGVGKRAGADICHRLGMENMSDNIREIACFMIQNLSIPFGVGIVENALHHTYLIRAIPGELILEEEMDLLKLSKSLVPIIPFDKVDVLVCERMGKDISGTGIDPNVIGRSPSLGVSQPFIEKIGVLRLSDQSHGNANGMGLADCVTKKMFDSISLEDTYLNAITSCETTAVKIPVIMPSDELCIKFLMKTCTYTGSQGIRFVWIKDTLSLNDFFVTENLISPECVDDRLSFSENLYCASFDDEGTFRGFESSFKTDIE